MAYGIFYDTCSKVTFDLGCEIDAFWGFFKKVEVDLGGLDYYMIYGPSIVDVARQFARLTGLPSLLPSYALGYLGSTMLYTGVYF